MLCAFHNSSYAVASQFSKSDEYDFVDTLIHRKDILLTVQTESCFVCVLLLRSVFPSHNLYFIDDLDILKKFPVFLSSIMCDKILNICSILLLKYKEMKLYFRKMHFC